MGVSVFGEPLLVGLKGQPEEKLIGPMCPNTEAQNKMALLASLQLHPKDIPHASKTQSL